MSDPLTALGPYIAGGILGKDILLKLLGPTAEYFGEGARDRAEKANSNLGRIFRVATRRLGERLSDRGGVNPRVAKAVWDEGRFVDDELAAEYFGGMLASARSEDGSDDAALPFLDALNAMSSDQIRLHYITYAGLAEHCFKRKREFTEQLLLYVPERTLKESLGDHSEEFAPSMLLAIQGLIHSRLVAPKFLFQVEGLSHGAGLFREDNSVDHGIVVGPSSRGASLFLRAMGFRGHSPEVLACLDLASTVDLNEVQRLPDEMRVGTAARFGLDEGPTPEWKLDQIMDTTSELDSQLDDLKSEISEAIAEIQSKLDSLNDPKES